MVRNKLLFQKMLPLLLAFLLTLAACGPAQPGPDDAGTPGGSSTGEEGPPGQDDTGGGPDTSGEGETDTPGEVLTLASGGVSSYRIVHGYSSLDAIAAVREFGALLEELTGADIPVYNALRDAPEEQPAEIVVGYVPARRGSTGLYASLTYSGVEVRVEGETIYIGAYTLSNLEKGVSFLTEAISKRENGDVVLPADYAYTHDDSEFGSEVPRYGAQPAGVNSAGSGNYEATFENVDAAAFEGYAAALESAGFAAYQTNTIGENRFGVYTKGQMQVSLSYYPSKQLFKLVYGGKGYLPSLTREEGPQLCTPSVTQPGRRGADLSSPDGAPGMSYIFQLPDGRYILVDGGPGNADDEAALLAFLQEHKPAGHEKPVIAAWFFTHAHGDHMQLACNFLRAYTDEIVLELVAYNFPDFDSLTLTHDSAKALGDQVQTLVRTVDIYYRDAATLVLHTGMRFWIGEAEIEILYTPEDFAPTTFPTGNHTSCAFRVRLGGKSILLLGDCERELCQFMADVYREELKSDILQLTHHGYNGACLDLYQYIDPDICFWASDEYRFLNDPRCLGTAAGYEFNAWIRDDSIRHREHYHCSADTTIPLG